MDYAVVTSHRAASRTSGPAMAVLDSADGDV